MKNIFKSLVIGAALIFACVFGANAQTPVIITNGLGGQPIINAWTNSLTYNGVTFFGTNINYVLYTNGAGQMVSNVVTTNSTSNFCSYVTTNYAPVTQPGSTNVIGTNVVQTPVYTLYWGQNWTNTQGRTLIYVNGVQTNQAAGCALIDLLVSNTVTGIAYSNSITTLSNQAASAIQNWSLSTQSFLGDIVTISTNRGGTANGYGANAAAGVGAGISRETFIQQ